MSGTISILDQTGDTTISWDDDRDDEMRRVIAKKMKEGYSFFIVSQRKIPGLPPLKRKVTDVKKIKENSIVLRDEDFLKLMTDGGINVDTAPARIGKAGAKRAATADEVVGKRSVATRPAKGG